MPIDPAQIDGAALPETTHAWSADDVILYHLGLGAGVPPTDAGELAYAYEADLKVLPTFATIPTFTSMMGVLGLDGLDVDPAMILHGEHAIEVHDAIPVAGSVTNRARVAGVHDKGKGALVRVVMESVGDDGVVLFTNTASLFIRGEGGFGGDPGPEPRNPAPDREPDRVVESATLPQQALLYRLSGDKNPLHADPAFAAFGGFDRPILHGLCSYGIVCRAVVDEALGGDVSAVAGYSARFSGVVFPGETIVTSMWQESDRWIVEAVTSERGSSVISNASVAVRVPDDL